MLRSMARCSLWTSSAKTLTYCQNTRHAAALLQLPNNAINKKGMGDIRKNNVLKDNKMIEKDKIVLGGDTTVITGEIIVDEHNRILKIKHD